MSLFSKLFQKASTDEAHQTTATENHEAATHSDETAAEQPKTGKKFNVYHLIVLDESGSMAPIKKQTISGCNETIKTIRQMQKENPDQQHYVSIYLFCTGNMRYIVKNEKVENVKTISRNDYHPSTCTPLFDALGNSLNDLKTVIRKNENMGYVTILTDGYENDSREYTLDMVRRLINELKKLEVIFTFVGANIDAAEYAKNLNINNHMQFQQTQEGTREMWEKDRRSRMRSNSQMSFARKYAAEEMTMFGDRGNSGSYYDEFIDERRITPERVTALKENEVFVFGSNIKGLHNGNAAALAVERFGAKLGQAEGLQGQSYAIPTVGVNEKEMYLAIDRFCRFAEEHPELTFLVTAVGCGTAGYSPYVVAPMFRKAIKLPNVKLPRAFWPFLDRAYA